MLLPRLDKGYLMRRLSNVGSTVPVPLNVTTVKVGDAASARKVTVLHRNIILGRLSHALRYARGRSVRVIRTLYATV